MKSELSTPVAVAVVVVVLAVVVAAGWWFMNRESGPPPVQTTVQGAAGEPTDGTQAASGQFSKPGVD
jgi:hypothetical protein